MTGETYPADQLPALLAGQKKPRKYRNDYLGDVRPVNSSDDFPCLPLANSELRSERIGGSSTRVILTPHRLNISVSHLGASNSVPSRFRFRMLVSSTALLLRHIGHVVRMRTKEEMVWIHA